VERIASQSCDNDVIGNVAENANQTGLESTTIS
jgi:hypothetical protein